MASSHPDPDPVGSPPHLEPDRPGRLPGGGPARPVFTESPLERLLGWWASRSWPGPGAVPPGAGTWTAFGAEAAGDGEAGPTRAMPGVSGHGPAPFGAGGARRWGRPRLGTVAGLFVAGAVGWWLLRPAPAPVEAVLPTAPPGASTPGGAAAPAAGTDGTRSGGAVGGAGGGDGVDADGSSTATTEAAPVVVQAAGAVHLPGVHRLPAGSRVDDLVSAAGGSTPDADLDRVNLAALLVDGERIWVPRRGEVDVPPVVSGGTTAAPGGSAGAGTGGGSGSSPRGGDPATPVDLNTATDAQLDALPGIGPATAAAILAHRDANGPFRSVDDLLDVRGIGEAKLEQLRPLVRV